MTDTEYIIDNGMLTQWRVGCIRANAPFNPEGICGGCEFDNKKRGGCDFDDGEMQKIFQSRPYPFPSQTRCPPPGCPCNRYADCKECVDAIEKENDELLTKLVQELAGTWRMRDAKLFSIIRKYRRVPIGAMKESLRTKPEEPK